MPPKAKNALATLSSAHEHLSKKFGAEYAKSLMVAAECGATVAIVFGRLGVLEDRILSFANDPHVEKALMYPNRQAKDDDGRSTLVRVPFIPLFSFLFSHPQHPEPELRRTLEPLASSFAECADAVAMIEMLASFARQLKAFYAEGSERRALFRHLKNPKQLMTAYVLEAAQARGTEGDITATDLAALGIVIDIEDAGAATRTYGERWQEVRKAVPAVRSRLAQLPKIKFSPTAIRMKAELPPGSVRPFFRVYAGLDNPGDDPQP